MLNYCAWYTMGSLLDLLKQDFNKLFLSIKIAILHNCRKEYMTSGHYSLGILNEAKGHGQRPQRAIYDPRAMGWTALLYCMAYLLFANHQSIDLIKYNYNSSSMII